MPRAPTPRVPGLLLHVFSDDPGAAARGAQVAVNAVADLPGTEIELVLQGRVVAVATTDTSAVDGHAESVARLDDISEVTVVVCGNSVNSLTADSRRRLRAGVTIVPAAVGHLARRQWEHWAYVRL